MSKKNNVVSIICWVVIGLVLGYLFFAKGANGKYLTCPGSHN